MSNNTISTIFYLSIFIISLFMIQFVMLASMYSDHKKFAGTESKSKFITIMTYKYLYNEYLDVLSVIIKYCKFEKVHYTDKDIKEYWFNVYSSTRVFMTIKGPYFIITDKDLNPRSVRIRFGSFIDFFRYLVLFNKCRDKLIKYQTKDSEYVNNDYIKSKIMTEEKWLWEDCE